MEIDWRIDVTIGKVLPAFRDEGGIDQTVPTTTDLKESITYR